MQPLSARQRRHFSDYGFLVVPGFFTPEEVDRARRAYRRVWEVLPADVTVDTEVTGRRLRARDLTEEERRQPFKVNDLYLVDEGLRNLVLSEQIGVLIAELLGDSPVICNTLSLEFGSQQADHLDTLFMTPRTEGALVATWMALEDVDADAGPLRYYPESNHIEPYRFESGGFHVLTAEMDRWGDYMAGAVDRYGLAETRFLARAGDLFIWDAWLLHGGSEICRPGLTRHSLVTHFFTASDCRALGSRLRPAPGGYWMDRPPQSPRDSLIASEPAPPADWQPSPPVLVGAGGAALPGGDAQPRPGRRLRERLNALLTMRD